MPTLSRFYGVAIRIYVELGEPHHRPHLHAYYQGYTAVVAIDQIEVLRGRLPKRQLKFVER